MAVSVQSCGFALDALHVRCSMKFRFPSAGSRRPETWCCSRCTDHARRILVSRVLLLARGQFFFSFLQVLRSRQSGLAGLTTHFGPCQRNVQVPSVSQSVSAFGTPVRPRRSRACGGASTPPPASRARGSFRAGLSPPLPRAGSLPFRQRPGAGSSRRAAPPCP